MGGKRTRLISPHEVCIAPSDLILVLISDSLCRIVTAMRKSPSKPQTLEERLAKRIARKRGDVFLREDFGDLGGYDQVGRALLGLVRKGQLLKLGYGIYTRAVKSPFTDKRVPPKGLATLTEALERLGIETVPTRLQQAYSDGRTTQVPTGRVVAVRGRVRRKIGYGGFQLGFERAGPSAR
jgi:hypothetical protein